MRVSETKRLKAVSKDSVEHTGASIVLIDIPVLLTVDAFNRRRLLE